MITRRRLCVTLCNIFYDPYITDIFRRRETSDVNKFRRYSEQNGTYSYSRAEGGRQRRRKSFYANTPCHRGMCLLDFSLPIQLHSSIAVDHRFDFEYREQEPDSSPRQFRATQRDHVQLVRDAGAFIICRKEIDSTAASRLLVSASKEATLTMQIYYVNEFWNFFSTASRAVTISTVGSAREELCSGILSIVTYYLRDLIINRSMCCS